MDVPSTLSPFIHLFCYMVSDVDDRHHWKKVAGNRNGQRKKDIFSNPSFREKTFSNGLSLLASVGSVLDFHRSRLLSQLPLPCSPAHGLVGLLPVRWFRPFIWQYPFSHGSRGILFVQISSGLISSLLSPPLPPRSSSRLLLAQDTSGCARAISREDRRRSSYIATSSSSRQQCVGKIGVSGGALGSGGRTRPLVSLPFTSTNQSGAIALHFFHF